MLAVPQLETDHFHIAKSLGLALPKLPTTLFPSRRLQSLQFSLVSLSSEARFGSFEKSGQIRTMSQHYDRRQTQRKIYQDRCLQLLQKQHGCDCNRKSDRGGDGSRGSIPRNFNTPNPNEADNGCGNPIEAKEAAQRCSYPFPSVESEPNRIAVAKHGKNSGDRRAKDTQPTRQ